MRSPCRTKGAHGRDAGPRRETRAAPGQRGRRRRPPASSRWKSAIQRAVVSSSRATSWPPRGCAPATRNARTRPSDSSPRRPSAWPIRRHRARPALPAQGQVSAVQAVNAPSGRCNAENDGLSLRNSPWQARCSRPAVGASRRSASAWLAAGRHARRGQHARSAATSASHTRQAQVSATTSHRATGARGRVPGAASTLGSSQPLALHQMGLPRPTARQRARRGPCARRPPAPPARRPAPRRAGATTWPCSHCSAARVRSVSCCGVTPQRSRGRDAAWPVAGPAGRILHLGRCPRSAAVQGDTPLGRRDGEQLVVERPVGDQRRVVAPSACRRAVRVEGSHRLAAAGSARPAASRQPRAPGMFQPGPVRARDVRSPQADGASSSASSCRKRFRRRYSQSSRSRRRARPRSPSEPASWSGAPRVGRWRVARRAEAVAHRAPTERSSACSTAQAAVRPGGRWSSRARRSSSS